MTRFTNIGRKRTYVEAGFTTGDVNTDDPTENSTADQSAPPVEVSTNPSSEAPKKKRKRNRGKKPKDPQPSGETSAETAGEYGDSNNANETQPSAKKSTSRKNKMKEKRLKGMSYVRRNC